MNKLSKELRRYYARYAERYPHLLERLQERKFVLYLYAILTFFVVAFFGFVIIRPTTLTIFTLRQEFEENEEVLEKLDEKLTSLSALDRQVENRASDIELLESNLPTTPDIPQLTRKIETIARSTNVVVRELDVGTIEIYPVTVVDSPFFSFPITITVEGDEGSINDFIAQLISFDRLLALDRVSTARIQDERSGAFIVARAFFYSLN